MKALRVSTILLIPLLQSCFLIASLWYEGYFFIFMLGSFLVTDMLLAPYFSENRKPADIFTYSFLPLALVPLTFLGSFFIEDPRLINAVIAINAFTQFFYFLNLYFFFYKPERYQERSLYHASSVMQILIFFYSSETLFGFSYYLDISQLYTFPPFILLLGGLFTQILWVRQISLREHAMVLLAGIIIFAELVIALSLLPSIYFVNALIATVCFSAFIHLSVAAIRKELTRLEVASTVILGLIVLLLVVGTASWR